MAKESKFKSFINGMAEDALADYAVRCITTPKYLRDQLARGYKVPRRKMMVRLADESRGVVTRDDLMTHFYPHCDFAAA